MNGLEHALQLIAEVNGTISERISPSQSGSSKRKSRPVKRIINDEEFDIGPDEECATMDATEPLLASIQQQISSYASEDSHREEDEGASSEVLSTGSVEESMDQLNGPAAEFLRKVAEALALGQANIPNINANFLQQQATGKDFSFENAVLFGNNAPIIPTQLSPMFANVSTADNSYNSPERLLQAMLTPNLNFGLGHNPMVTSPPTNGLLQSPLIAPSPNFLQSLMSTQVTPTTTRKPENRPPVVSQTLKATKRRLFTDDERARAEAANLNNDERIDMSDLEAFAQTFKKQRIKFGFTQGDVGVALGKRYGTDFSQTTISRFEALNLSFKNMCKLRPLLKEWLADVETAIEGGATITDLIERRSSTVTNFTVMPEIHVTTTPTEVANSSPIPVIQNLLVSRDQQVKRRRKRTNLDLNQRNSLDAFFNLNPRPDHDKMTEIANTLELDRDVVRVWFCNRRQKMRRIDEPNEGEVATPSVSPMFSSLQHLSTFEQLREAAKLASAHSNNDDSEGSSGSPDTHSVSMDDCVDV